MTQKLVGFVLVLSLFAASPAYAAEGGLLSPDPGLIVWTIITFLIVLGLLWKFAYPPILSAVEQREERLQELLASAARDREEAQKFLEEQRRELDETRARAQELFAEGRAAGDRLREDLLRQAREEREEMLARARHDIERQTERMNAAVREEAVELAIAAAEKVIGRNLTAQDNERLVEQFIESVTRNGDGAFVGTEPRAEV